MKNLYSCVPDTFYAELDGSHYLLNISSAKYYILSTEAAVVWVNLQEPIEVKDLTCRINNGIECSTHQLSEHSVRVIIQELVKLHLVDVSNTHV